MLLIYQGDDAKAVVQLSYEGYAQTVGDSEYPSQTWIEEILAIIRASAEKDPDNHTAFFVRANTAGEARALMIAFQRYAVAYNRGDIEEIPLPLLEWAAAHLEALAHDDRKSAEEAVGFFHITPKKGRPRQSNDRNVRIMLRVEVLREKEGLSMMDACAQVADEFGIEESNAKKIYLRLRNSGYYLDEEGEVAIPCPF